MTSDVQGHNPTHGDASTVPVQFTLPRWAIEGAGLDEATIDQAAREALVLDMFRLGRLSRPDVGRMLGLDRFEVGAFLKRHQVFDDPTHEEVDADVNASMGLIGKRPPTRRREVHEV